MQTREAAAADQQVPERELIVDHFCGAAASQHGGKNRRGGAREARARGAARQSLQKRVSPK